MDDLVVALRRCLGDAFVLTAAGDVAPFATDWRGRYQGTPRCVALPATTEEVALAPSPQEVLRRAS